MDIVISPQGEVRCVYDEAIDLHELGPLQIRRASYVEPSPEGRWRADLAPVDGPVLGPFDLRTEALSARGLVLRQDAAIGSVAHALGPPPDSRLMYSPGSRA